MRFAAEILGTPRWVVERTQLHRIDIGAFKAGCSSARVALGCVPTLVIFTLNCVWRVRRRRWVTLRVHQFLISDDGSKIFRVVRFEELVDLQHGAQQFVKTSSMSWLELRVLSDPV